jgi:hypothetical protein
MEIPTLNAAQRAVVLGPDVVARAAARTVGEPAERWLLLQPRAVRRSFVEQVLDCRDDPAAAERWMLLQDDRVRRSYVEQVLA